MSNKCALIVDDDPGIRRLLAAALTRHGVTLDDAADGEVALQRMTGKAYDVILLDLMMPRVDGIEVLQRMEAAGIETPVIVLSAASERFIQQVDSSLVTKVMRKPFDLNEVVRDVLRFCVAPVPPDLQ
jgi:DNA-binding response OmpR family regulator